MKKLLLLEEELAASGNCEHWVKLEFSDGDYMVDVMHPTAKAGGLSQPTRFPAIRGSDG